MRERVLFYFPLARGAGGLQRAALHELVQHFALLPEKGGILFPKRIPPFEPPEKGKGSCPLTPHIAGFGLEGLHALRSVSAVYVASPRAPTFRYIYQPRALRSARVTVVWRQTACASAALLRSPPLWRPSLSPHQSSIFPCFSS
jgi:hypothetical protein